MMTNAGMRTAIPWSKGEREITFNGQPMDGAAPSTNRDWLQQFAVSHFIQLWVVVSGLTGLPGTPNPVVYVGRLPSKGLDSSDGRALVH